MERRQANLPQASFYPADQEIVHFPGMTPHEFNPRKSVPPDLHQPLFYKDVQTNFRVPEFTVDLTAHFNSCFHWRRSVTVCRSGKDV